MTKPDIREVLLAHGAHVPLRAGWIPVKCPYHGDTSASASVNIDLQKYRCHACGVKGDAYDLIQEWEDCDYRTAKTIGQNYRSLTVATPTKKRADLW